MTYQYKVGDNVRIKRVEAFDASQEAQARSVAIVLAQQNGDYEALQRLMPPSEIALITGIYTEGFSGILNGEEYQWSNTGEVLSGSDRNATLEIH